MYKQLGGMGGHMIAGLLEKARQEKAWHERRAVYHDDMAAMLDDEKKRLAPTMRGLAGAHFLKTGDIGPILRLAAQELGLAPEDRGKQSSYWHRGKAQYYRQRCADKLAKIKAELADRGYYESI